MKKNIIELRDVVKLYPGVAALSNVSFSIQEGEVHALVGENGAGKSTLIKVIAGAIAVTSGEIIVDNNTYSSTHLPNLEENPVRVVYQELNLVPSMSVAENIFLGQKVGKSRTFVNLREMRNSAQKLVDNLGIDVDVSETVENLTVGKQQMVEIAKALSATAKVIVMDEPSASLSAAEVEHLFRMVRTLKERGVTVIYITHRMDEIFEIADRVTVLRDGRYIDTRNISDVTRKDLIPLMVGRELSETYPQRTACSNKIVLETKNLTGNGDRDISLYLRKGEILGLAGLIGAGRTEFAEMLVGLVRPESGEILINGKSCTIASPSQALDLGIGLIPEDRKQKGAFLDFSIKWNNEMAILKKISRYTLIPRKKAAEISEKYAKQMNIKAPSLETEVRTLSGGNQQKVVLCKTLACETDILIMDEPTRGIDVGAKKEIYNLMCSLTEQGVSIIMITSDMEELLGMSDRIVVMHEGRLTGELQPEAFSQQKVLEYAAGIV